MTADMWLAAAILVGAYALIFTEVLHRTSAAIVGAVLMIIAGMAAGFYSQEAAILAVDANTLLLLTAMMMLVATLRPTGAFDYTAIVIARLSGHDPRRLLINLGLAVSLISMILDNVTTIIVFAPLTVLICRILRLNPLPFLMSEALLSNIGGAATLVGDPPNIMIGSAASLSFNDFLVHMAPPIALVWIVSTAFLLIVFRRELDPRQHEMDVEQFDLRHAIRDPSRLRMILAALAVVVALFFLHHELGILPALAAFIGLSLALVLVRVEPEALFGEVNWSVLVFFASLFIIVGGVEASGLLDLLGRRLASLAKEPDKLLLAALVLMWVAAALSAVVDNIPFTVTMIPIIAGLESQGANISPLWWALAIGVGLGGNSTHIGATANIIAVAEAEKSGIAGARISPVAWMRVGIPVTVMGLGVAALFYTLFFDYFLD